MIPLEFKFAGTRCGLKNKRNDLGIIFSERPALAAGVLTTNQVQAACVGHTRSVLESGQLRAVVVNSGNANCCTGAQGLRDTAAMAEITAGLLEIASSDVAVGSTGVIGHLLDMAKVERGIHQAVKVLGSDPAPFMDAILTTDLVEKWAATDLAGSALLTPTNPAGELGSGRIYGVAKGSGMMAPNMATMLSYIVTDLDASGLDLKAILRRAADKSFNAMTVDGDTSTNDMLLVLANGASGIKVSEADFDQRLTEICVSLAKQIARDGEGATKLLEVKVTGTDDPKTVARTIANSPLVKTAMFGCDPNWGRVLMAAGKSGVTFNPALARLALNIGEETHLLFEEGAPAAFDPKRVSTALKSDHVVIDLHLGEGDTATIYSCDFGYGYVRINAEYHT